VFPVSYERTAIQGSPTTSSALFLIDRRHA